MFESKMLIMAGVEMAVLLLVLCVALLFYVRGLRRLVAALEGKVTDLRQTVKSVRGEAVVARSELAELQKSPLRTGDYGLCLDEQIVASRDYYRTLDPDHDISRDMQIASDPERQMVSLRHAFLNAERESWSVEEGRIDWSLFEARLGRIIRLYDPLGLTVVDSAGAVLEAKKGKEEGLQGRIEELERFKALYLEAVAQSQSHYEALLQSGLALDGGDDFVALLERYAGLWRPLGAEPAGKMETVGENAPSQSAGVGRLVIANQQEVLRLRNMAVDQHRMIIRLRQQLDAAQSLEEKERVIVELRDQLERHQRFLHEYDLCSRQLEDELERLLGENETLRRELAQPSSADAVGEVERLKHLVDEFTRQSCDMLSAVETLEKENARLHERLKGEVAAVAATPVA